MVQKYIYYPEILSNEDDISYYLLGAFITDGCVYRNGTNNYACQLSSTDIDWLDLIKKQFGSNLKLHNFRDNYYGLRIIRNNISQWFIDHGCLPRKTLTVNFPNVPIKFMPDFLRGLIDGDGSIGIYSSEVNGKNYTKYSCQFISASYKLIEGFKKTTDDYDIHSAITKKKMIDHELNDKIIKSKHQSFSLGFSNKNTAKLLKILYYPNHKLSMPSKNITAQKIINCYQHNELAS